MFSSVIMFVVSEMNSIKLIKQEDLSIYVRNKFKHVENTYYEKYYNYQMIKQMEQEYSEEQN